MVRVIGSAVGRVSKKIKERKKRSKKRNNVGNYRRSMGLTLHRPSMNEYTVRQLPQELQRMRSSRVILLIMPQHSRGIAIAALAAYSIGLHAKLVICVQLMPESCMVSGELVTMTLSN